jgi:hypothetical protein
MAGSRVGKYIKALEAGHLLHEIRKGIIKRCISVFGSMLILVGNAIM